MCAKIVTVLNRKGGVGKTTLTIAIADTLISEHNANVTIVDFDLKRPRARFCSPKSLSRRERIMVKIFPACLRPSSSRKRT